MALSLLKTTSQQPILSHAKGCEKPKVDKVAAKAEFEEFWANKDAEASQL